MSTDPQTEADADTVANRAAQVITRMGADIRALTGERDRYRTAWRSARERAQAYGEGILRVVKDREQYQEWLRQAEERAAMPAAPVAAPPTGQTGLREVIAAALYRHEWPGKQVWEQALAMDREAFLAQADAVLPVLPETARLHDEILTLRADQAKMRDLLRSENERANSAIDRETTAEEAEEEHRLALSDALGLGTGAPWDAIRVRAAELAGQGLVEDDEGDELVCIDECGLCDACGMEPFGTPAEGWREAARFLRRTARDSGNREGALHGARLIETELRRLADEAPQPETQAAPDTASLAKVVRWVTSEVVVTKTEFGNGYRAAQRDIRDLMNGPSRLAAVAEPGKESVWCSAVALRVHHAPHDWEPQPGMTPVHCGGHPAPAVTLPGKEA